MKIRPSDIDLEFVKEKYSRSKDYNRFISNLILMCYIKNDVWLIDWTAVDYEQTTGYIWNRNYRQLSIQNNLLVIYLNPMDLNTFNFTGKFFLSILPFVKGGIK